MASSVKCNSVSIDPNTGVVLVNFDGGEQLEFPSVAAAYNACVLFDSDKAVAQKFLIGSWLSKDPSGLNPASWIHGKTCTVNCTADNRVTITG